MTARPPTAPIELQALKDARLVALVPSKFLDDLRTAVAKINRENNLSMSDADVVRLCVGAFLEYYDREGEFTLPLEVRPKKRKGDLLQYPEANDAHAMVAEEQAVLDAGRVAAREGERAKPKPAHKKKA